MNRQITLARPEGFPKESDFALVEADVPSPGPGEVLVRSQWLSLDPYMRGRMSTARSYAKPTELGEPMTGQVVGEVVESKDSRFAPGDTVVGQLGWQDYAVARGGALQARPVARSTADRPARTRRHWPDRLLRSLRHRPGEAGRRRRRLGRVGRGRPGRRPAGEDRGLRPGRGARRLSREGRRPDRAVRLRRRDRLQARRRQHRAQGGVPERRRRVLRQRRRGDLGDGLPPARTRREGRSAARSRSTTWPSRSWRRAISAS